jgi:DNA-binding MarR family transcriptional regulator
MKRQALVAQVDRCVREVSAQSVVTSQAVADRFGLHTTDLEALDLILMRGQASAGDLAAATGLTSGAVTALIDRLAAAGYVERAADPNDRRRTLVRIVPHTVEPIQAVYEPMQKRMHELWSEFSDRELEVVVDFLSRSLELAVECVTELRGDRPSPSAGATRSPSRRRR